MTIALFGSIWGLIEATAGGLLHLARVPFTGTIMSSIGFAILFLALRSGAKLAHLAIISFVAASFKFLDCWLFGIPVFDITIVNPATAIACQGLAASLIFKGLTDQDRVLSLAPRFAFAAGASIIIFNLISLGIYGWPTYQSQHPINTALIQLPIMTVLATILSKALLIASKRLHLTMDVGWKAATAVGCVVFSVIARTII